MHLKLTVFVFIIMCTFAAFAGDAKLGAHVRQPKSAENSKQNTKESLPLEEAVDMNEISDRIQFSEPYKSLLQTTARFALAQTQIPNHLNIDTAMDLLNDGLFMLSKPAVLFKTVKMLMSAVAVFLVSTFFFPGSYKFIDTLWRDPVNALNLDKYFSNGISERTVIGALGSKADETLNKVGLPDHMCRERTMCYMGEIVKCTFPETSDTVSRFMSDNFSNSAYKENRYVKSFLNGFAEQNCTKMGTDGGDSHNCLSSFFNSVLLSRMNNESIRQRAKFQTIPVVRA